MKFIIDGGYLFYLIIDTYYLIVSMREWTYSFIYYLIAYVIFFVNLGIVS